MLRLPNIGITIPWNYKQDEVADMCIRLSPKYAIVQKEGWKVVQFKGKYATCMIALL
jgi:hypothetical protein